MWLETKGRTAGSERKDEHRNCRLYDETRSWRQAVVTICTGALTAQAYMGSSHVNSRLRWIVTTVLRKCGVPMARIIGVGRIWTGACQIQTGCYAGIQLSLNTPINSECRIEIRKCASRCSSSYCRSECRDWIMTGLVWMNSARHQVGWYTVFPTLCRVRNAKFVACKCNFQRGCTTLLSARYAMPEHVSDPILRGPQPVAASRSHQPCQDVPDASLPSGLSYHTAGMHPCHGPE